MMSDFRVRAVDATIKFAIEHNAAANSRADGYVDQARAISTRAPSGFRERSRVAVVLQCHAYTKNLREILDRTFPSPSRKEIDVAKFSAQGINRTGRSDADAGKVGPGSLRGFAQHMRDQFDSIGVTVGIGGRFHPRKHFTVVIDHADRDFCASNVDRADHEYSGVIAFASSRVMRPLFL